MKCRYTRERDTRSAIIAPVPVIDCLLVDINSSNTLVPVQYFNVKGKSGLFGLFFTLLFLILQILCL